MSQCHCSFTRSLTYSCIPESPLFFFPCSSFLVLLSFFFSLSEEAEGKREAREGEGKGREGKGGPTRTRFLLLYIMFVVFCLIIIILIFVIVVVVVVVVKCQIVSNFIGFRFPCVLSLPRITTTCYFMCSCWGLACDALLTECPGPLLSIDIFILTHRSRLSVLSNVRSTRLCNLHTCVYSQVNRRTRK